MEVKAVAKYVKVQPRKVRQVAREVRGKGAVHMVHVLRFHPSKSAFALRKVLVSAIANAQENHNLDSDKLVVRAIMVDEGPKMKRIQARAMGRANRILKKTSHITVVVEDVESEGTVKPHGTKAKARPTLAVKSGKKKAAKAAKTEETVTEEVVEEVVVDEVPVAEETTEVTAEADATETTAEAPAEAPAEEAAEEPAAEEGDKS